MEAVAASLRKLIWSTSAASSASNASLSRTTPSITNSGSPNAPRMRMLEEAPARPEVLVTFTPGARPARALDRLDGARFTSSPAFTGVTAPVRFTFFCVPYPTTTSSFSPFAEVVSTTSTRACAPTAISCVLYPTKRNTSTAPVSGTLIVYSPLGLVTVPLVVPFRAMLTPGRPVPVPSVTLPEIFLS